MLVSLVSSILSARFLRPLPPPVRRSEINTSGYRCRLVRPPFHLLLSDICNVGDVVHHFLAILQPLRQAGMGGHKYHFLPPFSLCLGN